MKYLKYTLAWLSAIVIGMEDMDAPDSSKRTIIEVYVVNKMSREFIGKYCVNQQREHQIIIKPGHKKTIQFFSSDGGLKNKFDLVAGYSTKCLLSNNKTAFSIEDLKGATMPVDMIRSMHVDDAEKYPETPQSWCVIL